jgi:hypothetical protein
LKEGRIGSLESEQPFPIPPNRSSILLPDAFALFEGPAGAGFLATEVADLLLPSNPEFVLPKNPAGSPFGPAPSLFLLFFSASSSEPDGLAWVAYAKKLSVIHPFL